MLKIQALTKVITECEKELSVTSFRGGKNYRCFGETFRFLLFKQTSVMNLSHRRGRCYKEEPTVTSAENISMLTAVISVSALHHSQLHATQTSTFCLLANGFCKKRLYCEYHNLYSWLILLVQVCTNSRCYVAMAKKLAYTIFGFSV